MTVNIEWARIFPGHYDLVKFDGEHINASRVLGPGDPPVDEGYKGCQFRMGDYHGSENYPFIPVNVKVTGKVWRKHQGLWMKRCRITIVGDCEPDRHCGGWIQFRCEPRNRWLQTYPNVADINENSSDKEVELAIAQAKPR